MQSRTAIRTLIFSVSAFLFIAMTCAAESKPQDGSTPRGQLSAVCTRAKAEFHPISQADVAEARTTLMEAFDRLDQRLTLAGAGGEEWRKYLHWEAMQGALRGDKPDVKLLTGIWARYSAGYDGLELVWFVDVQRALHNYIATIGAVDNPRIRKAYEKTLDRLAARLDAYAAQQTTDGALVISELVRWLQEARQTPELVHAIQQHYAQPNVFAEVAAEIVGAGMVESVDDVTQVSDYILGTSVCGTAHTVGKTSVALSPNAEMGVIDTLFFGTADSNNVGEHHPVTILSSATTRLAACKRIWIHDGGLSAFPAVSTAETSIQICDIQSSKGRRIVERMAWKRAGKQQSEAECIASRHAEARLNERIDDQAAEPLDRANTQYVEKFKRPFSERKLFPQVLRFSTTAKALCLLALQAGDGHLGAPGSPPPAVEGADMSLRLHESAINNLAFDALAGRTVYEEKVQAAVTDALGRLPEKFKGDEDGKPWAITFAARQPVAVSFADNGFKVTIHGVKYYKGPNSYPAMNVSAVYKIEQSPKGVKAVRQGEIEVFPPDFTPGTGQQLDTQRQIIRTLLTKRFAKVFEPEFLGQGIELSGRWKAAGKLMPIQVVCRDGWLVIAWKRAAAEKGSAEKY
jgi:hypothetical protein